MLSSFTLKIFLFLILFFVFSFASSFLFPSIAKAEDCGCSFLNSCQQLFCDNCEVGINCSYSQNNSCAGSGLPCTTSCINGICQEESPPEPDCDTTCNSWDEYNCQGACPSAAVIYRNCEECCTCCNGDCDCSTDCEDWQIFEDCDDWENCLNENCQCEGSCLNLPDGPFPENGAEKVKLPVTLMWNAVGGARSYHYKIEGVVEDIIPTSYVTIKNCILESNKSYNWKVKACCNLDGTNCGSWSSNWNFKTSLAPELLTPEHNATNVPIPVTLDWCDVEEAQSYYVMIYKEGKFYYPFPVEKENDILNSETSFGPAVFTKYTSYNWEIATCFNEDNTWCGVDCEENQEGSECGDYSQRWRLTTSEISLPIPEITSPKTQDGTPVVNLSSYLKWKPIGIYGVDSYRYEIKKGEDIVASSFTPIETVTVSFADFWNNLDFNEIYTGEVKSCWDEKGNNCEDEGDEVIFKTTGAPPTNLNESPTDVTGKPIIPVKLDWDDMPGAASYYYEIADATGTVINSEVSIDYPILEQEITYNWQVKTCANKGGKVCGGPTTHSFTTFRLSSPVNPNPENSGDLLTSQKYLRWDKVLGAKFYQYKVDYGGSEKIPSTIVSSNSALLPVRELELGNYTWWVKACLDEECQESGDLAGPWHFILVEGEKYQEKGIVPCGRDYDNLQTPWNERETCQFKHIFIMLKNILDFILWRLGLIILVLLTIATGVIYYFSMGAPQTMIKVKSLLKSAGLGYGVIFLSWILLNVILVILGYQWEIFGKWWKITF